MSQIFEGIDGLMRAQALTEEGVDETMVEALHLAYGIAAEIIAGDSPLHAYLKKQRTALIEGFKVLPHLKPTDVDSIVTLQRAIENYRDLVNFLTENVAAVQSRDSDDEGGSDSQPFGEEPGGEPPPAEGEDG